MRIEAMSEKMVKARGKTVPVYSFKCDDGQWYSTGFKKPMVGKGDEVEFEFDSTAYGNQVRFESIKLTGSGSHTDSVQPTSGVPFRKPYVPASAGRVFPIPPLHGDRSIVRQNALTNARELVSKLVDWSDKDSPTIEEATKQIIQVARQFEAYTAGDIERLGADKMEKDKGHE